MLSHKIEQNTASIAKSLVRIAAALEFKITPELVRLNDNLEGNLEEEDTEEDGI